MALVVSGTIQAVIEVGSWEALTSTVYGQGVLIKVAVLLAMLVIALAVRLGRGRFERGIKAELALGIAVLAVAAVVAGTTPGRQAAPPQTTVAAQVSP
jgi:putative copper export protein